MKKLSTLFYTAKYSKLLSLRSNFPISNGPLLHRVLRNPYSVNSLASPNSQARRTCSPSGEWGPVDVSGCTFRNGENVIAVVTVTVSTTTTRREVFSSTGVDRLSSQLRILYDFPVNCEVMFTSNSCVGARARVTLNESYNTYWHLCFNYSYSLLEGVFTVYCCYLLATVVQFTQL